MNRVSLMSGLLDHTVKLLAVGDQRRAEALQRSEQQIRFVCSAIHLAQLEDALVEFDRHDLQRRQQKTGVMVAEVIRPRAELEADKYWDSAVTRFLCICLNSAECADVEIDVGWGLKREITDDEEGGFEQLPRNQCLHATAIANLLQPLCIKVDFVGVGGRSSDTVVGSAGNRLEFH